MSRLALSPEAVDPAPLLGAWVSASPATRGIRAVDVTAGAGGLVLRVFGAGEQDGVDWGTAGGDLYPCSEEDRQRSACLLATYDLGFLHCELQLRVNKGVLSLTSFNTFRDGSGRCDYVIRELFHRAGDGSQR